MGVNINKGEFMAGIDSQEFGKMQADVANINTNLERSMTQTGEFHKIVLEDIRTHKSENREDFKECHKRITFNKNLLIKLIIILVASGVLGGGAFKLWG